MSARPINFDRIACVYENQPLAIDSTFAVPRLLAQLLAWLAETNPDVEILAASSSGKPIDGVRNLSVEPAAAAKVWCRIANSRRTRPIRNTFGPFRTMQQLRATTALRSLAKKRDARTCVICSTHIPVILARKYLPNAKIIYWIQSMPRLGQEEEALKAVNCADVVVAPTRAIYRDLFQLISRNCFAPPVWVIPNYADGSRFRVCPAGELPQVRAEIGLTEDEVAIVHVGRTPEKGLRIVAAALATADFRGRKVALVSAGGSKQDIQVLENGAKIIEVGRVEPDQLNRIYQACDFGVVPSVWWENCPLALLEMMSVGLCPIGSRVGGIPEIIDHGRNGLLVDSPNDVQAWADAIQTVLFDEELRRRLGGRAEHTVEQKFGREQQFAKWAQVLKTIAN